MTLLDLPNSHVKIQPSHVTAIALKTTIEEAERERYSVIIYTNHAGADIIIPCGLCVEEATQMKRDIRDAIDHANSNDLPKLRRYIAEYQNELALAGVGAALFALLPLIF